MKQFQILFCAAILLLVLTIPAIAAVQTVPVILYHRLGTVIHPLYLSPERFENQMKALKEAGYTTLTLKQYEDFVVGAVSELPEKPILITFDDGDIDNYEVAFPVLKNYGMKATFFIPTAYLDQADKLTSSQVLEMHHAGMSFGSHTVTHRRLANLNEAELCKELEQSKQTLEDLLQNPVNSIAYPGGSYNETVMLLVKKFSYKAGFSTLSGQNSRSTPPLLMKRIPIFSYSPHILRLIENAK